MAVLAALPEVILVSGGGDPSADDPLSELRVDAAAAAAAAAMVAAAGVADTELKKCPEEEDEDASSIPIEVRPSGLKSSASPRGPRSRPAIKSPSSSVG